MKKNIAVLSLAYTMLLTLLVLSGAFSGIWSELIYWLAFILPFAYATFRARGQSGTDKSYLTIVSSDAKASLPVIAPTVSLVMLVSYLTSLLIFAVTGKTNQVDIGDSLVLALLSHALVPAVLEEMLFRYLPMRLLAPYSKRGAIVISAIFFALVHHSLFSIPYAFVAGVIFMAVDLASDSVIPSVLIHFINNALSVGLILYSDNPAFAPIIYCIVGVLTVISVVIIIAKRKEYLAKINYAFEKGEKTVIIPEMIIFAIFALSIAAISLC